MYECAFTKQVFTSPDLLNLIKDFSGIWSERSLFWITRAKPRQWSYNWIDSDPLWIIPSKKYEIRILQPASRIAFNNIDYKVKGYSGVLFFQKDYNYIFPGGVNRVSDKNYDELSCLVAHPLPFVLLDVICDPNKGTYWARNEHDCYLFDLARMALFLELQDKPDFTNWLRTVVPALNDWGKLFSKAFPLPTPNVLDQLQERNIPKDVAFLIIQYTENIKYTQQSIPNNLKKFKPLASIKASHSYRNEPFPLVALVECNCKNVKLVSYYERGNIDEWQRFLWKQDTDVVLFIGKYTTTQLHCYDTVEKAGEEPTTENCKFLWAGVVGSGALLIKTSRDSCYAVERYSFYYVTQTGKRAQKTFNFNGRQFPIIAYIPEFDLIVMYTEKELCVHDINLARVASLEISTVDNHNWKYDSALHFLDARQGIYYQGGL